MIGKRLKELRYSHNRMTQAELAEKLGVSQQAIGAWETGKSTPENKNVIQIAKIFNVSLDELMGTPFAGQKPGQFLTFADQIQPIPKERRIPRLGRIACGLPILAEENIEGFEYLTGGIDADFALTVRGESMAPDGLHDGFVVFIKQMDDVEDGEDIAAILIDGEATLKRIYRTNDTVTLSASNPQFPPLIYRKNDCNSIRILGKAVGFQGKL